MPRSTAQRTASQKLSEELTSEKLAAVAAVGHPQARQRKVTIWNLVQPSPGENVDTPVPLVMLFLTAHITAS